MEIHSLKAATRETGGKKSARNVRAAGALPGVLYGGGQEPVSLVINHREFEAAVHHSRGGEHAILRLEIEDKPELSSPVLLKAVQHHPLRGNFLHADFLRIRMDERIVTVVPVRLEGQAPGVAEGGILDHQLREVEVECLALDVPEEVVVNVSSLHIGDSVHLAAVKFPENVTVLTESDRPVVTVHAPRVVKEVVPEEAVEEEAAAEPEVIGERKEKEKEKEKE
ncbi:MAG TPA: 50S ribosomal protein L25 [Candidatus Bathyarchaeia archaeon]|nr:50S ribosomal protein L25 [Candidatus Bathyarchaeia archaeon]